VNGLFISVMVGREEHPDGGRPDMNRRVDFTRSLPVTLEELESSANPS
jgi:hypothetical protein